MRLKKQNNPNQSPNYRHYSYNQTTQLSPTSYPSSLQSTELVFGQNISRLKNLSELQHSIVTEYLDSVDNKSLQELLVQREEFLQQLHSINSRLNEMITQVYGDFQNLPSSQPPQNQKHNQEPQNSKRKPNPHLKKTQNLNEQELAILQNKNNKLIQSLQNELADFQFMLTGEYIDQLDQEIEKSHAVKKQLEYQVASIQKEINKYTKAFDKQAMAKLQKSTYDTELQLTLLNKKLQARILKLNSLSAQIQEKSTKIQAISSQENDLQRLLQMYEDEQYESADTARKKKQSYDKLLIKRQKLQKIINSYNNNHLKLYNKKLCDFRAIDEKIQFLKETIKQMDYKIVLVARNRRQFELENQDVLKSQKNFSSLINPARKLTLKMERATLDEGGPVLSQKNISEDDSIVKRNQLKFMKGSQTKEKPNGQNQIKPLEESRPQQNDIRRRIYTELESSHYFASIQKNNSSKVLETEEQAPKFGNNKGQNKKKQLGNAIQKSQIFIPTTDKQASPKVNLNKQTKIQQKRFNMSNTPLSKNQQKEANQNQHKSFSFYGSGSEKSQILQPSDLSSQQNGKTYSKAKSINRKGVSHNIEKDSEDEIEKRLIYLQNLLKKGHTHEISGTQIEEEDQRMEESGKRESNLSKQSRNTATKKSVKEESQRSLPKVRNDLYTKAMMKKGVGSNYKELCQKLGKDKLLIEEDEDISSLIYQGMSRNN